MRLRSGSTLLAIVWLLSGCHGLQPTPPDGTSRPPASPSQSITPLPDEPATQDVGSTHGCYYTWATRELPDLSVELRSRLAALGSETLAGAYAFGEECRAETGEVTFLAMETDFRVRVPVDSLGNEAAMAEAIRDAMVAIQALPQEQIQGPRPGRVEFEFAAADSQSLRLVVDIARFVQEAERFEGAALFRYLQSAH